mmetsp:Transcript_3381/g.7463  ORF Transcript_3381/g.7463 Transcript_3381/m.7463 type:complete len:244 (+) Transcript_3381:1063-1794(+)
MLILLIPQTKHTIVQVIQKVHISQCCIKSGTLIQANAAIPSITQSTIPLVEMIQFVNIGNARFALHNLNKLLCIISGFSFTIGGYEEDGFGSSRAGDATIVVVAIARMGEGSSNECPLFVQLLLSNIHVVLSSSLHGRIVLVFNDILQVHHSAAKPARFRLGCDLLGEHLGGSGLGSVVDGQVSPWVLRAIQLLQLRPTTGIAIHHAGTSAVPAVSRGVSLRRRLANQIIRASQQYDGGGTEC